MILKYLTLFFRQFRKSRSVLVLNMLGLTLGLSCAILGIMFLINESRFDQFHVKKEHLVRLYKKNVSINDGTMVLTAETSGMMGPTLVDDYPEVTGFVRILPWFEETVLSYEDKHQKSGQVLFADSTFFELFSFPLLRGRENDVLKHPLSIVLSESLARRLFGDEDPVGKTVIGLQDLEYQVTGVAADVPEHSHIRFDALISWSTTVPGHGPLEYDFMNNWLGQTLFTYLEIAPDTDPGALEDKMPEFMGRHFPERADSYFLRFQSLRDIYMGSSGIKYGRSLRLGNPRYTYTFIGAALFVLLIACVNYINIQTARASKRAGEIGIRKVLGAGKRQLAVQFFGEAFLFVVLSAALSLLLVDMAMPYFNEMAGTSLTPDLLTDPLVIAGIAGMILLTAVLAGIYPAIILASIAPASTIKSISGRPAGTLSRKLLITFQYVISIILIISSIVIFSQTRYMMTSDVGFDKDRLMVMNINNDIEPKYQEFMGELRSVPGIVSVTAGQATMGTGWFGTTIIPEGRDDELSVSAFRIGEDFFSTLGIEMVAGREFMPGSSLDSSAVIINQAMADLLGYEDPTGHTIRFSRDSDPQHIIGVTRNFHYEALNESSVRPAVMYLYPGNKYHLTVRLAGTDLEQTLAHIRDTWHRFEDRFPFDYYFVSDWFDSQYNRELLLLNTILIYSVMSILLAFLGLYGLTTFLIQQRMKEFSIRKVLGATQLGITLSMNSSLALMVVAGFVVGLPAAWYFTRDWLNGFAYRVDIPWWTYGLAGLLVLFITVVSVSLQLWRATRVNPAEILRNE